MSFFFIFRIAFAVAGFGGIVSAVTAIIFAVTADVSIFHLRLWLSGRWKKSPEGIRAKIRETGWGYSVRFFGELIVGDLIAPNYKFDQLGIAPLRTPFLRVVWRDEKKIVLLPLDRRAKETGGKEVEVKASLLRGKIYLIENGEAISDRRL